MTGRFYLIPVAGAMPALQGHFARHPDDSILPSPDELRQLVELTCQFVAASSALLDYARAVGGKPQMC